MKDLKFLRDQVEMYFESNGYKEPCRKRYRHTWDHLMVFVGENEHHYYTPEVGIQFLNEYHSGKSYVELSKREKERYRHIDVLSDVLSYGMVRPHELKIIKIL